MYVSVRWVCVLCAFLVPGGDRKKVSGHLEQELQVVVTYIVDAGN